MGTHPVDPILSWPEVGRDSGGWRTVDGTSLKPHSPPAVRAAYPVCAQVYLCACKAPLQASWVPEGKSD